MFAKQFFGSQTASGSGGWLSGLGGARSDAGPLVTQLAQQIAGQGAGIEFSAYVAELVRNAKVQLNEKVFE